MASDLSDIIYFTVCLNGLMLIDTLNGKNSISYTLHAGNLSLYSIEINTQSKASETICEKSFNYSAFRKYYNTLFGNAPKHLYDNWLSLFIGFVLFLIPLKSYCALGRCAIQNLTCAKKSDASYIYIKNEYTPLLLKICISAFVSSMNSKLSISNMYSKFHVRRMHTGGYPSHTPNPVSCNGLVVWGQNLPSGVGLGRLNKHISNTIKLPHFQKSVIIGLILSDGWLIFASPTSSNALLGWQQSIAKFEYVWFVFNLLSHYCNKCPRLTSRIIKGKRFHGLQFFTRSMPCFTELYFLFYPKGVKIIPKDIYNLLTPVALAHLIMGDGQSRDLGLVLCTDSFTLQEVVLLLNVLIIRYNFICTIRTNNPGQYRIYISEKSMNSLKTKVSPFMTKTMLYKINTGKQ